MKTPSQNNQNNNVMRVMHTPLLGPICVTPTVHSGQAGHMQKTHSNGSWAGIISVGRDCTNKADTRKYLQVQTSPNFVIANNVRLNKSPSVIGGRVEGFGNITDMIGHWEGQEAEMEKEEKKGGRRRSKVIEELSLIFEEGDGGGHDSLPGSSGGISNNGEGRDISISRHSSETKSTKSTSVYKQGNIQANITGAGVRTPSTSSTTAKNNIYKLKQTFLFSTTNDNRPVLGLANKKTVGSREISGGGKCIVSNTKKQRKCI
jgi:hypothetical protein